MNPKIDEFVARHPNLQALPESTIRVLRLTRDSNCNIPQLLKLIERDAALSARIMKAVNSSFYALESKITRLDRAVTFMGLKAVKEVTVSSSLSGLCKEIPIGDYSARDLWDHSVGVAILSRELAIHSKTIDPEDAFLAGMLHDVGLLLAIQTELESSEAIFKSVSGGNISFTSAERNIFGFDHCELGERLSHNWKFPDFVAGVIRWHHEPDQAPEDVRTASHHIYIADCLCCQANVGFPLTCAHQEISDQSLEQAHLSRETITEVTAKLPILLRLHLG